MSEPNTTGWKYLDRKPGSVYRQLFIEGRNIAARTLYGMYMSEEEPMTPEQIAEAWDLPLEVVQEAIAYCETNPPEIRYDWEMEEASIRELEKNDPNFLSEAKVKAILRKMEAEGRLPKD